MESLTPGPELENNQDQLLSPNSLPQPDFHENVTYRAQNVLARVLSK